MKVALLGISHPHAAPLLTTLENLPEITQVHLWDSDPAVVASAPPASSRWASCVWPPRQPSDTST